MITFFGPFLRAATLRVADKVASNLPAGLADKLGSWMTEAAEYASSTAPRSVGARYLATAGRLLELAAINNRMIVVEDHLRLGRFNQAARLYREQIGRQPTLSTVYATGMRLAKSGQMGDAFTRAAIDAIETQELRAMMLALLKASPIYHPSRLWLYFMIYNAFQIETAGVEHFKKTVNHNYFNWTSDADIGLQSRTLQATLGLSDSMAESLEREVQASLALKPLEFSRDKWRTYGRFLALLWELASRSDRLGLLETCSEPELGDPLSVRYKGRTITQDLCNSVIDVNTLFSGVKTGLAGNLHIAELGAGHGRLENILLRAAPNARVTIIDIPPALYVSQWYLSRLFPKRRVFAFREFEDFEQVRAEFEAADITFLLPSQAPLLPGKIFDGFINICSLQEMTAAQIEMWFSHIDRLCRGWFFSKQYKISHNGFDDITIRRSDYPVKANWSPVFDRDNPGNSSLFEALYEIG